ncbi:MAG: DUF3105 domain-containing protein [bacterium]|nr:DUF3105 domain-containing protein [bacterium]
MENTISKKEEYDLKKRQEESSKKRANSFKAARTIALVLGGVALIGTLVFFFMTNQKELGQDLSREMAYEGDTHVAEGTEVAYDSNPPTSGNHWPVPLSDGVYKTEKPDEAIVHSLEHGRVWISYKPSLSASIVEQLEKLGTGQALIVTPRSENETDMALAAWTRLDTFNLSPDGILDAQRVKDFIKRYKNKGPEFIPGHGGGKTYEE